MKLKAIAAAFKRNKLLKLYTAENGEQWIGNGNAIYKMTDMPELTITAILKIFDIPEDKQADWKYDSEEMPLTLQELCYRRFSNEQELKKMKISIDWLGTVNIFFKGLTNIYAVDEKLIKPLYDELDDMLFVAQPFGSKNGYRGTAICCYSGDLQAVIMPYTYSGNVLVELTQIVQYFDSDKYEAFPADSRIDPKTGEVLNTNERA